MAPNTIEFLKNHPSPRVVHYYIIVRHGFVASARRRTTKPINICFYFDFIITECYINMITFEITIINSND